MVFSRKFKRGSQVTRALVRNGLGWAVQYYGLRKHLPFLNKIFFKKGDSSDLPVKLRKSLEDLGGAFVKLGQMLSLREDLIPGEYCNEFRKLLDDVPAMPVRSVKKVVEAELGRSCNELFSSFDNKPLGSASIAQVHKAVLKSGKTVVVKVQRPRVEQIMKDDVELLYALARRLEHRFEGRISPMRIVDEFERYTSQELDFMHEAANVDAFHKGYVGRTDVKIPRVHWNYTTKKILMMDYIDGKKLSGAKVKNGALLAKKLIDNVLFQVFTLGKFHADLHPGNILLCKRNTLGFLDFGIVGDLTPDVREKGVALWMGMVNGDLDAIVRALEDAGFPDGKTNVEEFRRAVYTALRQWQQDHSRRPSRVLRALFETSVKYHIRLPVDLVLLGKAFLTVEGTSAMLDPSFDFYGYARKEAQRMAKERLRPDLVASRVASKSKELAEVLYRIPKETLHLLDHVKHGKVLIDLDDTDIKHLGMDINKSSNRLSYAMLVAALAVTGAMTINIGPGIGGFSFISIVFFALAFFFMWPLIVSILHEGHPLYDPH